MPKLKSLKDLKNKTLAGREGDVRALRKRFQTSLCSLCQQSWGCRFMKHKVDWKSSRDVCALVRGK